MIGVHIRIHDEVYDWKVVPPSPGCFSLVPSLTSGEVDSERKATAFGEKTKLADFRAQMISIQEKLGRSSTQYPTSQHGSPRFFIASNDMATKRAFGE